MPHEKLEPLEVTRRGDYPIYKYTIRQPGQWYSCIMIDEEVGNVLVNYDIHYFGHYWGKTGRGEKTLRQFLARAGTGYVADKFSYHRSRYNGEKTEREWTEAIEAAFKEGKLDEIEKDTLLDELVSDLIGNCRTSREYSLAVMGFNEQDLIDRVFPNGYEEYPRGEDYACLEVQRFVDNVWPFFQEFIRNELLAEARDKDAVELMDR